MSFLGSPDLFLQGLSAAQGHSKHIRLASQGAPETHQSLLFQHEDCRLATPCPDFLLLFGFF